MAALLLFGAATELAAQTTRPSIASRRIVKHFDFNERSLGNYESTPLFWRRHVAQGFALFLEGKFDWEVFHSASPSFRLDLDGSSVAYEYLGGDIAVRSSSDYLISAWIRTDGLETARAYLTACYLDRKKNPIEGTTVRSVPVGGLHADPEWEAVTIGLAGNVPEARYIGLAVWLTQQDIWNTAARGPRTIEHEDVAGTAWFDDITVYRLPRVQLTAGNPGQVFGANEPPVLLTEISDPDGLNLTATLTIRSEDGALIDQREVPLQSLTDTRPYATTYDELPIGLYHAELDVSTAGISLVRRELSFARIPEPAAPPTSIGRGFGVILRDLDKRARPAQIELLKRLGVEYVKLPVWSPHWATDDEAARRGIERYLEAIAEARIEPIGILTDGSGEARHGIRPMLDILSETPSAWRPLIGATWARFAGLVRVWQVGEDTSESIARDERIADLTPVLHREMSTLMSDPLLATLARAGEPNDSAQPAEYSAIFLPESIPTNAIAAHLGPLLKDDSRRTWISIEAPGIDQYAREARLGDLARRLVEAAWQRPGAVFLEAPWSLHHSGLAASVELREDYLVLRTVADLLGEATPIMRLRLDGHAECMLFDRNGRSVMFAWDAGAPPGGREYALPLGESAYQLDLWGRPLPVGRRGELRTIRIGPQPSFVLNAPTWLMAFRGQFRIQTGRIEAGTEPALHTFVFRNTWNHPISGVLRLTGPPDWELEPSRIPFVLGPDEEFRQAVRIRLPINAPAGLMPVVGEFDLEADQRYRLAIPAWVEVGLKNVDVKAFAYRTGDRLGIRLVITNQMPAPIHFEAQLIAPGRARIIRLFTNFQPGQPTAKTFMLEHAAELRGRQIRLTLREHQGARFWNQIITVP